MFEGAVVGSFRFIRETAARQLAVFQVVAQAVAADALAGTGFVTAVAGFEIEVLFAFHGVGRFLVWLLGWIFYGFIKRFEIRVKLPG